MRLFSEPESWIGLRSERTVAGEFDAPVVRPAMLRTALGEHPARSWPAMRLAMRRSLAMLLGR